MMEMDPLFFGLFVAAVAALSFMIGFFIGHGRGRTWERARSEEAARVRAEAHSRYSAVRHRCSCDDPEEGDEREV